MARNVSPHRGGGAVPFVQLGIALSGGFPRDPLQPSAFTRLDLLQRDLAIFLHGVQQFTSLWRYVSLRVLDLLGMFDKRLNDGRGPLVNQLQRVPYRLDNENGHFRGTLPERVADVELGDVVGRQSGSCHATIRRMARVCSRGAT